MFLRHPSSELNELFAERPFQGAAPEQAQFLFVGLDANYDAEVAHRPIFSRVLDYHRDGIGFWQRSGVHHPFLLPDYSGSGKKYHRSFAEIGFRPDHANLVSFVELMHIPTVGRSKLCPDDFAASHLKALNTFILEGRAEHIFVSAGVARLMCATAAFPWMPKTIPSSSELLGIRCRIGTKKVYSHLHFSVYGKFERQKREEAAAIRGLIPAV